MQRKVEVEIKKYIIVARRIIAFPVFMIAKIIIIMAYAFGWGIRDAIKLWNDLK